MVIEAFETERLKIREYTRRDIDAFLSVIQQPEIRATTVGIPEDYTRSRAKEWFRFLQQARMKMQSLEYGVFLKNTGRVSGFTAAIGTVLNIKPILYGDHTGHIVACSKVRGRRKAVGH